MKANHFNVVDSFATWLTKRKERVLEYFQLAFKIARRTKSSETLHHSLRFRTVLYIN